MTIYTSLKQPLCRWWRAGVVGVVLSGASLLAAAETAGPYPVKAVRMVIGFPPGGTTDQVGRLVAQKFSELWGQAVIVENRSGAAGNIAAENVAKSAPDGYTLMMGFDGTLVINPSVYPKLGFDTLRDFTAISRVADAPVGIAAYPGFGAKTCAEMVAMARAKPGALSFASVGSGSTGHLAAELMLEQAKLKMTHVPYRGGGPATIDVIGGQVPLLYATLGTVAPHVRSGKLRLLAVTGARRNSAFPDVPTVAECGFPGFDVVSWFGLVAPIGTPQYIVKKLHADVLKVLAMQDVRERFAGMGAIGAGSTPREFSDQMASEITRWRKLVKDIDMKPD
jgi:tripartite-type tricarboxylate transporter receptor subunit TctC